MSKFIYARSSDFVYFLNDKYFHIFVWLNCVLVIFLNEF